jgi:hypothetical protein
MHMDRVVHSITPSIYCIGSKSIFARSAELGLYMIDETIGHFVTSLREKSMG